MPIKLKIFNNKEVRVAVTVRRPTWQEYLEY